MELSASTVRVKVRLVCGCFVAVERALDELDKLLGHHLAVGRELWLVAQVVEEGHGGLLDVVVLGPLLVLEVAHLVVLELDVLLLSGRLLLLFVLLLGGRRRRRLVFGFLNLGVRVLLLVQGDDLLVGWLCPCL